MDPEWYRTARLPDDPPLSEDGRVQARELGLRLRRESIAHVFCSPFLRTIQTAGIAAEVLGREVRIEHGLAEWLNPEWFRAWPELTPMEDHRAAFPGIDPSYRSFVEPRYPETEAQMHERAGRAARAIAAAFPGNLLLVGHGASVDGAAWGLAGGGWEVGSWLCAIVKLVGFDGRWRVVLNGDTSHLSRPEGAVAPRAPQHEPRREA